MKNALNNYLHKVFVFCGILTIAAFVGCGNDHKEHDQNEMQKQETAVDKSIIRTGMIDLQMIDLNKDGKAYQDQMCWNVISDEAGECPQCGMILKEVSLDKAKENLVKNDFEVK